MPAVGVPFPLLKFQSLSTANSEFTGMTREEHREIEKALNLKFSSFFHLVFKCCSSCTMFKLKGNTCERTSHSFIVCQNIIS